MNIYSPAPTLYLGTFNSEYFWRNKDSSELPSITDSQSDAILSVVDEMQFVFCKNPADVLISRLAMDKAHKEYLHEIGFSFINNDVSVADYKDPGDNVSEITSICSLINKRTEQEHFRNVTKHIIKFSPFSILPDTKRLLENLSLAETVPSNEIVRMVNSKVYSTNLSKQLPNGKIEEIVYSSKELQTIGSQLLKSSQILVKDPLGVSGKGNFLIPSEKLLSRICNHIEKQELNGKKTCFVVETLLNKKTDFSCQLFIHEKGQVDIVTVQVMQNKAFAFSGIQTADTEFYCFLERLGYFNQMEWIGKELFKQGYYGPVCIDSMVDQQDKIVPIIEINARKSMGLMNYQIDQYLANFGLQGNLMFIPIILKERIPIDRFFQRLDIQELLFTKKRSKGILPLTTNSINVNISANNGDSQSFKGRFYFSIIAGTPQERELLLLKLSGVFNEFNAKIVN